MKLILTALCASFMVIPAAFASDCEKGKCDKDKKTEGTLLAHCGKCEGDKKEGDKKEADKKEGDKKEGAIAACNKCKKGEEEKKTEGTLV